MGFFADFQKFAFKGNVVDLAVGVVIGGAFTKIVTAVVNDFIMPVVSLGMPGGNWREGAIVLKQMADPKENVALKYGDFLGVLLDFLLVALVLFIVVSKVVKAAEGKLGLGAAEAKPDVKECPFCFETVPRKATRCKSCTSELKLTA